MRGSFIGTVTQFGYQLGTLISFWAGYGMSFHKEPYQIAWRVSNLIQIPIGLLFFTMSFWYPESPVSLSGIRCTQSIGSISNLTLLALASGKISKRPNQSTKTVGLCA
jgi:hypothetical protein